MNRVVAFTITLFALLLSANMLFAQTGTLKGFVIDKESGEPCMFANVSIPIGTTVLGASTDDNGFFSIPKIPVGSHTLTISYLGYTDYAEEFSIDKEGQLL